MRRLAKRAAPWALPAAIAVFIVAAGSAAHAQPLPWDPPCAETKIVNTTGCNVNVTLNTAAFPFVQGPFAVPAGGSVMAALVPAGGVTITGVTTQAGAFVGMGPGGAIIPSPPAAPGTPAVGVITGVTLGPGCCVDMYFDASGAPGCWIWLVPGTPPCTP